MILEIMKLSCLTGGIKTAQFVSRYNKFNENKHKHKPKTTKYTHRTVWRIIETNTSEKGCHGIIEISGNLVETGNYKYLLQILDSIFVDLSPDSAK